MPNENGAPTKRNGVAVPLPVLIVTVTMFVGLFCFVAVREIAGGDAAKARIEALETAVATLRQQEIESRSDLRVDIEGLKGELRLTQEMLRRLEARGHGGG